MSERDDLLTSVAGTLRDYRAGDLDEPTPEHVDRWLRQFGKAVQVPLLRELDFVFKQTYFSKAFVRSLFANQIRHPQLAGEDPCTFWRAAHLLDIQQHGHSQAEIRQLFGGALREECGLEIDACGSAGGPFIYLDDVLFSGNRIGTDLSTWIANEAPARASVHVLVIAAHRLGEWQCTKSLKMAAERAGKTLEFRCWAAIRFENRKSYRNTAEVLWPAEIPEDQALQDYVAQERKFPFEPRQAGGRLKNPIFSSEQGRQLLERELLVAGVRIRSFCQNPKPVLRPLGFSQFGLGFGSLVVTFRNCPNNAPLALWWGDTNAAPGHPFRRWYPLLPRKTYSQEDDF